MGTYDQIVFLQLNSNPLIAPTPHIKEARSVPDVPNLLVLMQMLVEERLDLLLVDIAHLLGRNGDYISVLVASLAGKLIDVCDVCEAEVEDAQLLEVFGADVASGVMEFALVAL